MYQKSFFKNAVFTKLAQIRFGTDNLASGLTQKFQSWAVYLKLKFQWFEQLFRKNWAQLGFRTDNSSSELKQNSKLNNEQKTETSVITQLHQQIWLKKFQKLQFRFPIYNQNFKVTNVPKNSFVIKTLYYKKTEISDTSQLFWKLAKKFRSWPMYKKLKFQWFRQIGLK